MPLGDDNNPWAGKGINQQVIVWHLMMKQGMAYITMSTCTNNFEKSVKVLGVVIDNQLTFTEHTCLCYEKVARQLNALSRVAKYFLDMKSRKITFDSFIMINFNYCPLVWHFGGKGNNDKFGTNTIKIITNPAEWHHVSKIIAMIRVKLPKWCIYL